MLPVTKVGEGKARVKELDVDLQIRILGPGDRDVLERVAQAFA